MNGNKQRMLRRRSGSMPSRRGLVLRSSKGGEGLVLRSAKRGAGFTLIEMLAVIAILGILMTVAVLGFNAFGRGVRLKTAARLIQQHLDGARELAMTRQYTCGVKFVAQNSPDRDYFYMYWKKGVTEVKMGKTTELPQGVEYGALSGGEVPNTVEFKPTGRAEGDPLTFKINDADAQREKEITVVPVTGHSEVTNE